MDACRVDVGVIAAGMTAEETGPLLDAVAAHPDRLRVALTVDRPDRPVTQVTGLRGLATHPAVALVRVTPLVNSTHSFLPMERAVATARDLPLSDAAAQAYLGGTAARLLHLD